MFAPVPTVIAEFKKLAKPKTSRFQVSLNAKWWCLIISCIIVLGASTYYATHLVSAIAVSISGAFLATIFFGENGEDEQEPLISYLVGIIYFSVVVGGAFCLCLKLLEIGLLAWIPWDRVQLDEPQIVRDRWDVELAKMEMTFHSLPLVISIVVVSSVLMFIGSFLMKKINRIKKLSLNPLIKMVFQAPLTMILICPLAGLWAIVLFSPFFLAEFFTSPPPPFAWDNFWNGLFRLI